VLNLLGDVSCPCELNYNERAVLYLNCVGADICDLECRNQVSVCSFLPAVCYGTLPVLTDKFFMHFSAHKNIRSFDVAATADLAADSYGYYYTNHNGSGWNYLDAYMQQEVTSVRANKVHFIGYFYVC